MDRITSDGALVLARRAVRSRLDGELVTWRMSGTPGSSSSTAGVPRAPEG